MEKTLQRNIIRIYLMVFFQSAMIITAVIVPLLQRHGLSMAQILQTQALFAAMVAACEVPSGYLADLWGRKNTIVLGAVICLCAFAWLTQADSFIDYLFFEFLIGIGISLNSGADLALIYDTQNALNECGSQYQGDSGKHVSRLTTIEGIGGAIAAIFASVFIQWSLDAILWAQLTISLMALLCAIRLTETPRKIALLSHRENVSQLHREVVDDPLVLWIAAAIVALSLSALFSFWLYQKYWEIQNIPVAWFGYVWAIHCIFRGMSAHYAPAVEQMLGPRKLIFLIACLPIIGFLGMGVFGGGLGLAFCLAFPISRGLSLVVFYQALNKRLSAEFRATVNSLVSLGIRGIFIVTGPLLGFLVDFHGVQFSLLALAAIFIPIYGVVLLPLSGKIKQQQKTSLEEAQLLGNQAIS